MGKIAHRFSHLSLLALLLPLPSPTTAQTSGTASLERYWDCCKPDCAWEGKADFNQPVQTCDKRNSPLDDFTSGSSCSGGAAYACADQAPWAVNDTFSYGFAGVYIQEHASDHWCCACYHLNFTSGRPQGKQMIVQSHNAAFDITDYNRFTIAAPGGNASSSESCMMQYGLSSSDAATSKAECNKLPEELRDACRWRFDWLEGDTGQTVNFKRVTCPEVLTNITGCIRNDDTTFTDAASSLTLSSTVLITISLMVAMFTYL